MNTARSNRRAHTLGLDWASPVRRHTELRWPGFIYIGTVLFLAIGAFNSQNALLFAAFGLGVAGVILSGIISGTALMGVSVVRETPGRYRVGRGGALHYRVRNRNGLMPIFALRVDEIDGTLAQHARLSPAGVVHCPAGEQVRTDATLQGVRHGRIALRLIRVRSSFPFGLMVKSIYFEQPGELVVRPARVDIRHDLLRPSGRGRMGKTARRNRVGTGGEIFGLREYLPGDSPRMIAWKQSASIDTLVVREMTSPAPPRAWIEIDEPPPGLDAHLLERGLAGAFSGAGVLIAQGNAVGVRAPWANLSIEPEGGQAQLEQIDRALAALGRGDPAEREPTSNGSSRREQGAQIRVSFAEAHGQSDGVTTIGVNAPERWLAPTAGLPAELLPPTPEPRHAWLPRLRLAGGDPDEGADR